MVALYARRMQIELSLHDLKSRNRTEIGTEEV